MTSPLIEAKKRYFWCYREPEFFAAGLLQRNWVPKELVEGGTNRHNWDEAEA